MGFEPTTPCLQTVRLAVVGAPGLGCCGPLPASCGLLRSVRVAHLWPAPSIAAGAQGSGGFWTFAAFALVSADATGLSDSFPPSSPRVAAHVARPEG
jgi:hypothetical protein